MHKLHKNTIIKLNNTKAFTLVEIMVAIILTTVVLTAAYQIWSRVRMSISRSYTKQTLQNELRKAANYMQNDFKSIKYYNKDDKDKNKAISIENSSDGSNFKMSFQKFKEVEENDKNKLAQDVLEEVQYTLNSNVLIRKCGGNSKLLTSHCEGIQLIRAFDEEGKGGEEYKNATEEVKEAKQAQLDIEITGKMRVSGSNEEIYHVEKTSVVMRNEYYNNINKTYISNFELAKMDSDDVIGEEADSVLTSDYDDTDFSKFDKDVLENMEESQKEILENLKNNIENIDDSIEATKPEDVPWYKKLFSNLDEIFAGKKDEYALFKDSRDELEKAKTPQKAKEALEKLKGKISEQEETFYKDSYTNYNSITEESEKVAFKRAYDMAIQQKTIDDAYEELNDPSAEKPKSNIDIQRDIVNSNNSSEDEKKEAQKIIDYYDKIDLSWMDKSEKKSEVGIYKANKNLLDQGNTKLELLKSQEEGNEALGKIQDELSKR